VSVSVGLGLANAARLIPPRSRRTLLAVHEQTALAALIAIAAHGLLLLPDHWLHPGVSGIAIPLAIGYRPLAVAAGIVAGYAAALLGLSFYVRRKIGPRLWRKLHMGTLGVYVLALVHTLTASTDAGTPWLLGILSARPPRSWGCSPSAPPPSRRRGRRHERRAGDRGRRPRRPALLRDAASRR